MAKKNEYALIENGKETGVFKGESYEQAAKKAVCRGYRDRGITRGYIEITLRKMGGKTTYRFKGSSKKVEAPENRPEWMPHEIWEPSVELVEIRRI